MMLQRYIFFLILLQKYTTFLSFGLLNAKILLTEIRNLKSGYNKLQVFCVIIA